MPGKIHTGDCFGRGSQQGETIAIAHQLSTWALFPLHAQVCSSPRSWLDFVALRVSGAVGEAIRALGCAISPGTGQELGGWDPRFLSQ